MVRRIMQVVAAYCLLIACLPLWGQNVFYVPFSVSSVYAGSQTKLYIEDLWQLIIMGERGGTADKYYRLKMTLIDRNNGDVLVQQWSWSFRMIEPVYSIDVREVSSWGKVDLRVLNGEWWRIVNNGGGTLPHGSYVVQIEIFETNKECTWTGITILKEQFNVDILPFFEVLLIYPENKDTLNSVEFFSWEEVSGQPVFYQVKVVRIENPERANQLSESINPIWQSVYLADKLWNTTGNTPSLERGWYAWYVQVVNPETKQLVTTSEVRTFYYQPNEGDYLKFSKGTYYYIDLSTTGIEVYSDTITIVFKGECMEEPRVSYSDDGIYYEPTEFVWESMIPEQSITLYRNNLKGGYLRISQCSQEYSLRLKGFQSRAKNERVTLLPKRR